MARQLDEHQKAELVSFVEAVFAAGNYETNAELARDSGYPASNISKLRNGRGAIDGFNLLRLIQAAARRTGTPAETIALAAAPASEAVPRSVADLERRLEEVADLTARGFEALGVTPAQLLPAEDEQPRATEDAQR